MSTRRSARLSAASDLKTLPAAEMTAPPQPTKRGRKRKADAEANEHTVDKGVPEAAAPAAPTTPAKRRAQKKSAAAPPATPTPSRAKLIAEPARDATAATAPATPKPKPAAVSRIADANATHALLLSPETSRVVKPGRGAAQTTTTTTATSLLEEANRHLISVDERMRPLVERNHCRVFSPEGLVEKIDPFESLCSGIISQQVSGAAARSIKKRFIELFNSGATEEEEEVEGGGEKDGAAAPFPHPSQVSACPLERLRTAGLSQRKAEYVQGLAQKFVAGELTAQLLADAPYEEVVERLTAVRGLGQWSVEMFACFGLKRPDVFSLGDLGVQRGMAAFEGRDVARLKKAKGGGSGGGKFKYMSEKEMGEIAARFAPYRSLFMWYMWRVEETDISTLE